MAIGDLFPGQAVRYSPEVMAALSPQVMAAPVATPAAAPAMTSIPGLGSIDLSGIDLSGIGYQSMGLSPDYTPAPNYLVKPTKGLTAADVALQELAGVPGLQFVTNKGNPAGVKNKETKEKGASGESNTSGFVPVVEGATYRIRDEKGKDEILYTGTGAEGLQNVYAIAQDLSASKGKKANWGVEMQLPGQEGWRRVADDDPAKGIGGALDVLGDLALGAIAGVATGGLALGPALAGAAVAGAAKAAGLNVTDIALPIVASAVLPGLAPGIAGALGKAGTAAVTTGIGSLGSSAIQGRSLEDALIRGGISALTAGVLEGTGAGDAIGKQFGKITDAIGIQPGPSLAEAIGGGTTGGVAGDFANTIVTAPLGGSAGSATLGGAVSGIGGIAAPTPSAPAQPSLEDQFDQALPAKPGAGDLTVTAARQARIDAAAAAIASGAGIGDPRLKDLPADEFAEAQERAGAITVTAPTTPPVTPVAGIGGTTSTTTTGGTKTSPEVEGEEITVTGNLGNTVLPIGGPLVPTGTVNQPVTPPENAPTTETEDGGLSTSDYIRLALAAPNLISGIGGLLGAGGDNTKLTQERSPLSYTPLNRTQTARPGAGGAPAFDVFTYGQNKPGAQQGEFTFFQPYDIKAAPQTYSPLTASEIYTQADVDAANNAIMSQYNSRLMDFNTYQDTLASQVASGAMTPAQAQVAAQQYAATLGTTAAAPAMAEGGEVDDDMVKHLMAYSQGGGHQGPGKVSGIGSGQEDLIPAWLSDGEYVWSAQDVADLGDGSTDEGVRRLDKMRQMVRKNAGRKDVKKIAKPQPKLDKMLKAVGGPV